MRGGLLGGIFVLTFLLCASIKGRRVLRSGYFFGNRGPLNQVAFLRNIVPEVAKFKRNVEINQDINQQTVTYTDVEDERSAAVAIANAVDSNYAAQNLYSPMSYFNKGNTNSQATASAQAMGNSQAAANAQAIGNSQAAANAQAMGNSQAAANAQAIANAQTSGSNIGSSYSGYGGYGGYRGYGVQQSPYYYPTSSSSTLAQSQTQALSNTGINPLVMNPSLLNTPSSSLSSALAQASANINSMGRNLYTNPYLRSRNAEDEENISQAFSNKGNSYPDLSSRSTASTLTSANSNSGEYNINGNLYFKSGEEENVSETERSAYAQAVANAQALSNNESTYPGLGPSNLNDLLPSSASSANAQANANSQEEGNLYNIPYFRSGEEDDKKMAEAERSAYANANANVQAISNAGSTRPRVKPSFYNIPGYSSSSALAQALAKTTLRGQKHNNYLYRNSGDDEIDQLSEAKRTAQDQTTTNIQATDNFKSIEEVAEPSHANNPSSRLSAAVIQPYQNDNNPNSKSDEIENLGELDHERSAYSQAIAKAYGTGNVGNSGFRIRPTLYNQPSSSISSALAQALANSNSRGSLYGSLYSKSGNPDEEQKSKYERSAESQEEEANERREAEKKSATSELLENPEPKTDNPINSKSAEVESSVDSKSDADGNSNSLTNIETLEKYVNKQAADDDNSDSDESRSAGFFPYQPSTPGFISRVLSNEELIDPNAISGQNIVQCTRPYEVHAVWLLTESCLICVCVQEYLGLRPVCASCNTCLAPPTPPPPPPPLPPMPDIIVPIPPLPQPIPVPQVSCDPLPTGTPFENPLNPCQTCICKQTTNVFGQPDVEIQCEENVQCMIPDIIPLPVPQPPSPSPTTVCENFALNVPFPSPFDECQICKCVLESYTLSSNLVCVRNPECDIIPAPLPPQPPVPPMPIPLPPLPLPTPDPEPFPIISPGTTDIEPMPWPPIIPRPKPKSPLPGPPPHETCQPYPPNTPFQHPWDDCQTCECSEIYGPNIINIEVSCYTKPSCCNDLPGPDPLPLPGPRPDQICQFQSLNVDFPSPTDSCKICNCQLFGTMILPVCRPSEENGCNVLPGPLPYGNVVYIEPKCQYREPYQSFVVECNLCYCQEVFQYVIAKCTNLPNCGTPGTSPFQISSEADAFAQATANANTNLQIPNYLSPLNSYNNIGNQLSSAIVDAQAESSANSYLSGLSGLPLTLNGNIDTNAISNAQSLGQSPYGVSPYSMVDSLNSALAQAEASSDVYSGSLYGNYPISSGVSGLSNAQAQADAIANTQSLGLSPFRSNPYLVGNSGSSSQAQAEAISSAQGGGLYNTYPYLSGSSALTNSQAQADAIANTQSLGLSPYGSSPYLVGGSGSSSQAQADAISGAQGGGLYDTYPYLSGSSALTNAQAQADAIANTQSLSLSPYGTNPYLLGGSGASSQAQADAISTAQGGGLYDTYPYLSGSSALTNAQAQADAIANTQSLSLSPYGSSPYLVGGSGANAQAQADAISNAQGGGLYNTYPYLSGGRALTNAQAQAEALANAQSLGTLPYGSYPYNTEDSASASAQAQALANSLYGNQSPLNSYPYSLLGGSQSNAQAQADAIANSQAGLNPSLNYQYPGSSQSSAQAQANAIASSQKYPNLYPLSTPNVNPLYGLSQGQTYSQTLANALAQSAGSASAQSLAQAAAQSGRPLIRSGRGLCQYDGDKYHLNCQACYCFRDITGDLYTLCLGNPCQ